MLRGAGHPPFRADHVGNLLRPPVLRHAFRRHGAGEIDDQAYRAVQDRCIREARRGKSRCPRLRPCIFIVAAISPRRLVDFYIDAINQAVAGRPADMVVGVHMCRGNFKGHYLAAGGYGSVAERFFANTHVDHFLLEYDTPRAGDFAPLRFVSKNKGVVLGLVSTKTPVLEDLDALKRRVDEAARAIDVERLAIGPQCGFASTVAGNPLGEEDQRAELALVVRAAGEIWHDRAVC